MLLSAFAPMGLMQLKGGDPDARVIYDAMIEGLGGSYNVDVGSRQEALCYASSIELARTRLRLRQAADQRLPSRVSEKLTQREAEYGITPAATDSVLTRRTTLAGRMALPQLPTRQVIETALANLLGSDFVLYRPTPIAEAVASPASLGDWPMNLQPDTIPRKAVSLLGEVSFVGVPSTVAYRTVNLGAQASFTPTGTTPMVGDTYVFDVGRMGQQDRVTITGLSIVIGIPTSTYYLTATFTRPHEAGVMGFTHPLPSWQSTKRHALIVLASGSAARSGATRRKINELMSRMVGASSTWDIIYGTSATAARWFLSLKSLGVSVITPLALP